MTEVPFAACQQLGPYRFSSSLAVKNKPARFVSDNVRVHSQLEETGEEETERRDVLFEKAGPRENVFFDAARTKAAVVTCGGLCPGLNNVIRSLFLELFHRYGVTDVVGIRYGFQGLNPQQGLPPVQLTQEFVRDIHKEGGTMLGTSRGPQDAKVMVDFLLDQNIDLLFCVGGDGTQRGAHDIVNELARRGAQVAVVGIPKTIDNDVRHCDRTFGYVTAVEKGREVVHLAHTEARGGVRGIGLVKLMGREAGFIACGVAVVSQEVNFVLIPELPFQLEGEHGFLAALEQRMDHRGHAVVVVAEGAGQFLFEKNSDLDASGNPRFHDIGLHLKERIGAHFKARNKPVDIKYIDPSYIIRSVPANSDDSWLCDQLARNAVHAAMAGRTDVIVGSKYNEFVHIPIPMAVEKKRRVELNGNLWYCVLATTGQPASLGGSAHCTPD